MKTAALSLWLGALAFVGAFVAYALAGRAVDAIMCWTSAVTLACAGICAWPTKRIRPTIELEESW